MTRKPLLIAALLIAFSLAVAGAAFMDAFVVEPAWPIVTRVTIVSPRLARALGGLTAAQISDIHVRGAPGFLERQVRRELARLNPDLLFITGDLVSRRLALRDFWAYAATLKPRIWAYAIPGDDDEGLINDTWLDDGWKRAGIGMLVDRMIPVVWSRTGEKLWLCGAASTFNWGTVRETIPEGEPVIALVHRPIDAKQAALAGFDLVLAGDTHGGQIGMGALHRFSAYARRSPYVAGLYRVRNTLLYVNRGTGWKARPMRFFCRPEITIFRFKEHGQMKDLKVLPGDA